MGDGGEMHSVLADATPKKGYVTRIRRSNSLPIQFPLKSVVRLLLPSVGVGL